MTTAEDTFGPVPTVSHVNNNRLDTPLGPLCWARWEIVLTLAESLLEGIELGTPRALQVQGRTDAAQDVLSENYLASLPEELQEFGGRLKRNIREFAEDAASRSLDPKDLAFAFDFEKYAGFAFYADAVTRDPGCLSP